MGHNTKLAVPDGHGGWKLRVYHRAERGKRSARYLIKCGCCDERVEIHYSDDGMEISGVHASIDEWQAVLLPLLQTKPGS